MYDSILEFIETPVELIIYFFIHIAIDNHKSIKNEKFFFISFYYMFYYFL